MNINLQLFFSILCLYFPLQASTSLENLMSVEEKKNTGYSSLTKKQQTALDTWINTHFTLNKTPPEGNSLSLSVNIQNGKELILSDGSRWSVDPQDQTISSIWITPFPLKLIPNDNPNYPMTLLNLSSEEAVKVKAISPQNNSK